MSISPDESLIVGSWVKIDERMTADSELQRIRSLIANELEFIATSPDGWEKLYRDRLDGRFWEKFLPHGAMQGGGPESLRVLDFKSAQKKYMLKVNV